MDQIEKLMRRVSKKERDRLERVIEKIIQNDWRGLDIKRIQKTKKYRIRVGRYRIIISSNKNGVVIETIRRRNERTYR